MSRLVSYNKLKRKGINDRIVFKKKTGSLPCSYIMRSILPVLFKVRNFEVYHPKKVLDIFSHIASRNTLVLLSADEKEELRNYLEKWGYDSSWVV